MSLTFDAEYADDPKDVMAALKAAYDREMLFLRDPAAWIFIDSCPESSVRYGKNAWAASRNFPLAKRKHKYSCAREFKNHGVSMSYNHINVNMISDAVKEKD